MNLRYKNILVILFLPFLWSCEDVITLDLKDGVEQLVVDGWLTDKPEDQKIKLTLSQPYFDNSDPNPALNAQVILFEEDSTAHPFIDFNNSGEYILPHTDISFLRQGKRYALYIKYQGEEYYAISQLMRVPGIDSIGFENFKFPFAPTDDSPQEGMFAQFYAKDPVGEGDTYWIRTTKNNKLLNKPSQISLAYDAGFSPGSKSDGLLFILPVRQSINDGLYVQNDLVHVELWSITPDAYYYLLQVRQESSNGGIFSTPPANIPTNIVNLNSASTKKAIGFFGLSATSSFSALADTLKAQPMR